MKQRFPSYLSEKSGFPDFVFGKLCLIESKRNWVGQLCAFHSISRNACKVHNINALNHFIPTESVIRMPMPLFVLKIHSSSWIRRHLLLISMRKIFLINPNQYVYIVNSLGFQFAIPCHATHTSEIAKRNEIKNRCARLRQPHPRPIRFQWMYEWEKDEIKNVQSMKWWLNLHRLACIINTFQRELYTLFFTGVINQWVCAFVCVQSTYIDDGQYEWQSWSHQFIHAINMEAGTQVVLIQYNSVFNEWKSKIWI